MNSYKKEYEYGFNDGDLNVKKLKKGHSIEVVKVISKLKKEPKWMLDKRLQAYKKFLEFDNPKWGPNLENIDFNEISYYVKPTNIVAEKWGDIPEKIRKTFDKLGISKQEQKWLGGIATQYDSEMIYAQAKEELNAKGVIFESTDNALKKYEELFKKYFGTLVDGAHNKYAALNMAFWSGGTFIYVPKNVKLGRPLQSYFRINSRGAGQFERTLIIVDEGAQVEYVEGCTAPTYTVDNLHAAVVEVFVEKHARCKYSTIQNWSDNVINLVTKVSILKERATMEWVDGNLGSRLNMKYPSCILEGDYSQGSTLSIALAMGKGIIQDAGAKMVHIGKDTKSTILSKSIAGAGGSVNYRGLVVQKDTAINSKSKVECDTLILDKDSKSDTIPTNIVHNSSSSIEHEALVSKINEREIFFLQSRGLTRNEAREMIILGFIEPLTKSIPLEYASELNKLIKIELESDIG